jgi:hypothetical protein
MVRTTTSTPAKREMKKKLSFGGGDEDDDYTRNIQIAELNALNAVLAVIRWKKHVGFYGDIEHGVQQPLHHQWQLHNQHGRRMTRISMIRPEFVEFVPKGTRRRRLVRVDPVQHGVHKCACGCGNKVTLPISPAKWRYLWNDERISFWPSVGNHSFPCKSHYWIEQNQIEWTLTMSTGEIEKNRASDRAERRRYLESRRNELSAEPAQDQGTYGRGLIDRLRGLIRR